MVQSQTTSSNGTAAAVASALRLLTEPGQVFELRIPKTARCGTVSGYFNAPDKAGEWAARWNGRCKAIYFTPNPAEPALLARRENRLEERADTTTGDDDILRRTRLLLDFDAVRPSGISATNPEHLAALDRAGRCRDWLAGLGWPEPVEADSGNGGHLVYRIDLPNDPDALALVNGVLHAVDFHCTDDAVTVDLTVGNAARIWKLPGTMVCKGDSTVDRPHRLARLLAAPDTLACVPRSLLEQLAGMVPKDEGKGKAGTGHTFTVGSGDFDLADWIEKHNLDVAREGPWKGSGYRWVLNTCPWNSDHTDNAAYIVRMSGGGIAAGCHHNGCAGKDWSDLREKYELGSKERREQARAAGQQSGAHQKNGQAGKGTPARLATTRLDSVKPQPVRYLVPDRIPLGKLTLFAGDGGHGKSTITLHLAAKVSSGKACFGLEYEPPPPGEVLLVSCEDDLADTVAPRLLAAGADLSRIHSVDGIRTSDGKLAPFSMAHYEALEAELRARPDVKLVVIDPAGAYVGRAGVDDHKDSALRALLAPLAELAARTGVAILIVMHLNKSVNVKAVQKVCGSVGYVNAVRAAFLVVPASKPDGDGEHVEDPERKLFLPLKFNLGPRPAGLAYKLLALPGEEQKPILAGMSHLGPDDLARLAGQLFRVEWLGVTDVTADAAIGEQRKREKGATRIEEAAVWIETFLAGYAYPSDEIMAAGKGAGFTWDNIKEAKVRLKAKGLRSTNRGQFGGTWWSGFGDVETWMLRPPSGSANERAPHTPQNPHYGPGKASGVHSGDSGESGESGEQEGDGEPTPERGDAWEPPNGVDTEVI